MQNQEIDLRTIVQEQAETARCCEKQHDEPANTRLEPWIEEYAASGAVKGGGGQCM